MRKIVTLFTLLFITTAIFAQKGKVTSALSYKESGDLQKAWETIQETIDPENSRSKRSIDWPRTWEGRGEILHEIHRQEKTDIVDEPLFKALESYQKAIELDEKERYLKSIKVDLTFLQTDFSNYAIKAYNNNNFEKSYKSFEKYLEISNMPLMKQEDGTQIVDTAIIYNTGLTAFKAEEFKTALKYFERSIEIDYNGAASFHFMFQSYQALGDTVKSIEILKEGFQKNPENEALIVELINYYIGQGDANDAIEYLDRAIAQNPKNVTYYTAKGSTLEKLERQEEAINVYKEAITKDSTLFTPYYNLGVIFYNRGVNVLNEATQLPPSATKEYDEKIAKGKNHLKEALPYIERSYELDSSEIAIMESLRLIYYRLQMNDKYDEINEKVQNISK
ncbi:MAG: tetratricopeptide repeat protein [Prolixibacteraceae bacterium]|jgi:tetratricopeptide (TPR) repeat protein|nr:tetratricopeptide repeat protein [Prolixibacteraceae bacterium]